MTLSEKQYNYICLTVNRISGIVLKEGKETLVKSRLLKRIKALRLKNFKEYIDYIKSRTGQNEIIKMVDAITTNKTSFFREPAHFDYLAEKIVPQLKNKRIRFWSAACSSGEEPYSLAMLLHEKITDIEKKDVKILSTDISSLMLNRALDGAYHKDHIDHIPNQYVDKYFCKIKGVDAKYQLKDNIRSIVQVSFLNLMGTWPMRGPFDVIFCRNVMIYFNRQTQGKLINRFWDLLSPNGYLFVGSSEGLAGIQHKFKYIKPAIYKK